MKKTIKAHLAAHEAKIAKRRKACALADLRKKKRGLHAAIARLTPPTEHLAQIRGTLAPILDESGQSAGFGVIE